MDIGIVTVFHHFQLKMENMIQRDALNIIGFAVWIILLVPTSYPATSPALTRYQQMTPQTRQRQRTMNIPTVRYATIPDTRILTAEMNYQDMITAITAIVLKGRTWRRGRNHPPQTRWTRRASPQRRVLNMPKKNAPEVPHAE